MPVNKEELAKDLATPEYQTLVKEELAKKEFVIQDKTEHQTFLERHKNDVIEKEIPARLKAVHDQYDKDTKELFGIDRNQDEKSYEYLKRAAKTKLAALETSQAKIVELEEAIKKGDPSGALAKKLEDEQNKFKLILKEKEETISGLQKQAQESTKSADVKLIYAELKKGFIKTLPPMFQRLETSVIEEATRLSVIKDGKLYKTNADGSIAKDSHYNEVTVEDWLKGEFKEVIEKKKEQGGSGSKDEPAFKGDPKTITVENFPYKDTIKTKAELMDYMEGLGIIRGTKQFDEIYKKYGFEKNLPAAV